MFVIYVTDEKWNCGKSGGIGKTRGGSETIQRKASYNLTLSFSEGSH